MPRCFGNIFNIIKTPDHRIYLLLLLEIGVFKLILYPIDNSIGGNMDLEQKDKGVIAVLLKRFENERYPRIKQLKAKVDTGAVLDQQDLTYLEQVLMDTHQVIAIITRHPEYGSLAKESLLMYEEIMSKSQLNSKKVSSN